MYQHNIVLFHFMFMIIFLGDMLLALYYDNIKSHTQKSNAFGMPTKLNIIIFIYIFIDLFML